MRPIGHRLTVTKDVPEWPCSGGVPGKDRGSEGHVAHFEPDARLGGAGVTPGGAKARTVLAGARGQLLGVAPPPVLAWLEGPDQGMLGGVPVCRGQACLIRTETLVVPSFRNSYPGSAFRTFVQDALPWSFEDWL